MTRLGQKRGASSSSLSNAAFQLGAAARLGRIAVDDVLAAAAQLLQCS